MSDGASDPLPQPRPPRSAARVLALTAGWLLLPFALWSGYRHFTQPEPDRPAPNVVGLLPNKLAWYAEHKDEFDLVWVGDSRTFCGMHPQLIDPLLGVHTFNLALWAHWLPTQWPYFQDLVEVLRPGTTVVWTLGRQNFHPVNPTVSTQYPVPLTDVPLYLWLGFSFAQLRPNLLEHSLLGWPLRPILQEVTALRGRCDAWAGSVLSAGLDRSPAPPDPWAAEADRLLAELQRDPNNLVARPFWHEGRVTSVEVYRQEGGYLRYELDRPFFRALQDRCRAAPELLAPPGKPWGDAPPDPSRWGLFLRILDLCAARGVHLIVNDIEEAPHVYASTPGSWEADRRFMRERVVPEVEARGFVYVHPDYDRLDDSDYFDRNHLNVDGVRRYTALLAQVIRPHLPGVSQRPAGAAGAGGS